MTVFITDVVRSPNPSRVFQAQMFNASVFAADFGALDDRRFYFIIRDQTSGWRASCMWKNAHQVSPLDWKWVHYFPTPDPWHAFVTQTPRRLDEFNSMLCTAQYLQNGPVRMVQLSGRFNDGGFAFIGLGISGDIPVWAPDELGLLSVLEVSPA